MNYQAIRNESIKLAEKLGAEINTSLPLLGNDVVLREEYDIVNRSLVLFAVVSYSYGFNRDAAISWLEDEGLIDSLSFAERECLLFEEGDKFFYRQQVEALYAFAWILGCVDEMSFGVSCDDSLIRRFPNLIKKETSIKYREQSKVREINDIVSSCDLAYCLHWAVNESYITNKPQPFNVSPHVIIERRRALEWVLSVDCWDDISLDT